MIYTVTAIVTSLFNFEPFFVDLLLGYFGILVYYILCPFMLKVETICRIFMWEGNAAVSLTAPLNLFYSLGLSDLA